MTLFAYFVLIASEMDWCVVAGSDGLVVDEIEEPGMKSVSDIVDRMNIAIEKWDEAEACDSGGGGGLCGTFDGVCQY